MGDGPEPLSYVESRGPGVTELPTVEPGDRPPIAGEVLEAEHPGWDREQIDLVLKGIGEGLHQLWGNGEDDFQMTKVDLERMGAPLHRMANRYEPLVRLSDYADPVMFTYGATMYAWRNALKRHRAILDERAGRTPRGAGYERGPAEPDVDAGELDDVDEQLDEQPERPSTNGQLRSRTVFPDAPIHQRRGTA